MAARNVAGSKKPRSLRMASEKRATPEKIRLNVAAQRAKSQKAGVASARDSERVRASDGAADSSGRSGVVPPSSGRFMDSGVGRTSSQERAAIAATEYPIADHTPRQSPVRSTA